MDYISTFAVGDEAPDFWLPNQHGDFTGLSDYDGRYVVVWWIPSTMAEMTPVCCDTIARSFGEHVLENPGLNVVGLSFDDIDLMRVFARRATVDFPLCSADIETGKAYGVYRGDEDEWNCFPRKRAFLVAPDGRIAKVYLNIDPDLFVPEVLADLAELAPKRGLFGRVLSGLKG